MPLRHRFFYVPTRSAQKKQEVLNSLGGYKKQEVLDGLGEHKKQEVLDGLGEHTLLGGGRCPPEIV